MSQEKPTKQSADTQAPLHTPGPWDVFSRTDEYGDVLYGITIDDRYLSEAEAEANQRVIAAAPHLLDACRVARESLWFMHTSSMIKLEPELLAFLDAAIAKAEGE